MDLPEKADMPEKPEIMETIAVLYEYDRDRMVTDNAAKLKCVRRLAALEWDGPRALAAVEYVIGHRHELWPR